MKKTPSNCGHSWGHLIFFAPRAHPVDFTDFRQFLGSNLKKYNRCSSAHVSYSIRSDLSVSRLCSSSLFFATSVSSAVNCFPFEHPFEQGRKDHHNHDGGHKRKNQTTTKSTREVWKEQGHVCIKTPSTRAISSAQTLSRLSKCYLWRRQTERKEPRSVTTETCTRLDGQTWRKAKQT